MALSTATRVPQLVITNVVLYSFTTLIVGLRMYTRARIIRKIITGDWWMLAAWFIATGQVILFTIYDYLGNAQHIWNVKPQNVSHFFLICWIIQMVYPLGLCVIKISVLFLYHELFPSDRFRVIITFVMGFVALMSTASVLAFAFQCTPVQSYWVLALWPTRRCVNGGVLSIATSALSCVTDIGILLMPMKFLLALRISTREKIQLIVLMSIGTLTCIASAMRFSAIRKVYLSADPSWEGFDLSLWSSFEYFFAIITACIPTIRPLWVKWIQKLKIMTRRKRLSATSDELSETRRPKFIQPKTQLPV